jgi:hypothetical protein
MCLRPHPVSPPTSVNGRTPHSPIISFFLFLSFCPLKHQMEKFVKKKDGKQICEDLRCIIYAEHDDANSLAVPCVFYRRVLYKTSFTFWLIDHGRYNQPTGLFSLLYSALTAAALFQSSSSSWSHRNGVQVGWLVNFKSFLCVMLFDCSLSRSLVHSHYLPRQSVIILDLVLIMRCRQDLQERELHLTALLFNYCAI